MAEPLRVAVIGTGAFGRNHLRVYRDLQKTNQNGIQLVAAVEPNATLRSELAATGIATFASADDLLASDLAVHAASVCVPTIHHAAVAEQLLRAGIDTLIEKPFAATLQEAAKIRDLASSLGRIVQIGHLERFNPAVTALAQNINHPMFFECHRLSIFTPRALDVDVVLDLMIHDLDIVLSLVKSPVREVRAVGIPVLSNKADIANVRIEFDSGCIANFTASRISTERVRKLRLFQHGQYMSVDFARQELFSIDVDANARQKIAALMTAPPELRAQLPAAATAQAAGTQPTEAHPSAGLSLRKFDVEQTEPLSLEIQDFVSAVRTRNQPRVSAEAGYNALALALRIAEEMATHAKRALTSR